MIKPLSSKEKAQWNVRIDIFDNNRDSWGTMAYFYDDTLINADQLPDEEDCIRIATECLERYNRVLQSNFRCIGVELCVTLKPTTQSEDPNDFIVLCPNSPSTVYYNLENGLLCVDNVIMQIGTALKAKDVLLDSGK